ncbi:hypothetical protein BRC19_01210 [Candidatus Saccharibacteria bacterium QS_5_54_17]|nr:MAG: hypothetical protein BRC19_01210 [Candidatus Saccharibacteria bacterium QS_5_54_17]
MSSQRQKTQSGKYRNERGDILVGWVEEEYNVDFGVRSDMTLKTYLKRQGVPSFAKVLDDVNQTQQKQQKPKKK